MNYFAAHVNTLSPLFPCGSNQPSVTLNTNPQESKRIPRVTSFQEFGKKNSKKSDPLRELILKNAREYLNATDQHPTWLITSIILSICYHQDQVNFIRLFDFDAVDF